MRKMSACEASRDTPLRDSLDGNTLGANGVMPVNSSGALSPA